MKKLYAKIVWFVLLCFPLCGSGQYKYMFVNDSDGFVNVRAEKNSNSKIVEKQYNLSIVSIDEEESTSEWASVWNGFIHRSRLKEVPEKLKDYILQNNINCNGTAFLVAADCPEVLFVGSVKDKLAKKLDGIYPDVTLEFDIEYELIDINNGKHIDPHNIICPVSSVKMQGDRIIFYDKQYMYSFFRNKKNICCMNLLPYYTYKKKNVLAENEKKEIVKKLSRLDEIIRLHDENKLEYYSLSHEVFGQNNFKLLDTIKNLYYNGDRDIKEYRKLLDFYPLDGEGTHVMEGYYMELWGYMNRGETELDQIYDVYN